MNIQQAKPEDAHTLASIVKELAHVYLQEGATSLPDWFAETITTSAFASRISNSDYLHLVYREADEIEGYIAIKDGCHLYHLFVRERSQGKGIARKLWHKARELNKSNLAYSVRSSIHAVPVYLKFGFQKVGNPV